jgi:hypothetical protein
MKSINQILIIPVLFSVGCSTLNISEINNREIGCFQPLKLAPSYESNNLRMDIIRRTYSESTGDSNNETTVTYNVPYHPFGFDLGNGLFYDLNENLSFRIDYFFQIRPLQDFKIYNNNGGVGQKRGSVLYTFRNDSLRISYPPGNKEHFRYLIKGLPDSLYFQCKGYPDYIITKDNKGMTCRVRNCIHRINYIDSTGTCYLTHNNKNPTPCRLSGNTIMLGRLLYLILNNDGARLEIRSPGRSHKLIYSIVKGRNTIYIFNKHYVGWKIEKNENTVSIYFNTKLISKYRLENI